MDQNETLRRLYTQMRDAARRLALDGIRRAAAPKPPSVQTPAQPQGEE